MKKSVFVLCLLYFTSVSASEELVQRFLDTKEELSFFLHGSNYASLRMLADELSNKKIAVKVISPNEFNPETSRNSAFYTYEIVFLSRDLEGAPSSSLRELFYHELLSSVGVGDADYNLSQMIKLIEDYSLDHEVINEMVQKRRKFSDAYFNEPLENRAMERNGGSIVGGGGDLNEIALKRAFVDDSISRMLDLLGEEYFDEDPKMMSQLFLDQLSRLSLKKEKCLLDKTIILKSSENSISYFVRYFVFYGPKAEPETLKNSLSGIEKGERIKRHNVIVVESVKELTEEKSKLGCLW